MSCTSCEKYRYNEDWTPQRKLGTHLLRVAGTPTPCWKCPKIPSSAPLKSRQYALEMTERNRRVWEHYVECKAIGRFPDDPIVIRHAGIIRHEEDVFSSSSVISRLEMIAKLLQKGAP